MEAILAALLHDLVEDTGITAEALAERFGATVARIVVENSDDMSLPKEARREARIAAAPKRSAQARTVKTADVISNLRAMVVSAPAGWGADRKLGYLKNCRDLIDAGRGANPTLEALFDDTAAQVERTVRDDAPFEIDGQRAIVRELENTLGTARASGLHGQYLSPRRGPRGCGETRGPGGAAVSVGHHRAVRRDLRRAAAADPRRTDPHRKHCGHRRVRADAVPCLRAALCRDRSRRPLYPRLRRLHQLPIAPVPQDVP